MSNFAEMLRVRRELLRSVGVRIQHRKIPLQREAAGARLRYQKQLTAMRKTMDQLIREILFPALPALVAQGNQDRAGVRADTAVDDILRIFSDITLQFATIHPPQQVERELFGVATETEQKQGAEFQRQAKAALGIELIVPEPFLQASISGFMSDNMDLVESLYGSQLDAFKAITSKGIRGGLRVESIRDEIIAKLGVSKSKASLLARDQTNKLQGELNQLRQENVGVEEYDWSTSKDERVRQRHGELEGTRQKWSDPPIVDPKTGRRAHPGGDFQCRCQALPVFPAEYLTF